LVAKARSQTQGRQRIPATIARVVGLVGSEAAAHLRRRGAGSAGLYPSRSLGRIDVAGQTGAKGPRNLAQMAMWACAENATEMTPSRPNSAHQSGNDLL
jgi:hypothetical protein